MKSLLQHINEAVEVQAVNEAVDTTTNYAELIDANDLLAKIVSLGIKPAAMPTPITRQFNVETVSTLQNLNAEEKTKAKLIDVYLQACSIDQRMMSILANLVMDIDKQKVNNSDIVAVGTVLSKMNTAKVGFDWDSRKVGFDVTFNDNVTVEEVVDAFKKLSKVETIFYDDVKDVFIGWKRK